MSYRVNTQSLIWHIGLRKKQIPIFCNNYRNRLQSRLNGKSTSSLEEGFDQVVTPFQEFIHDQKTASVLLLLSTLAALLIANSPLAHAYHGLVEMRIGLFFGDRDYSMSLHQWVNDGLMALFFFTLGLEVKRELKIGE